MAWVALTLFACCMPAVFDPCGPVCLTPVPLQGSYEGLRAWGIGQLVRLGGGKEGGKKEKESKTREGEKKVGVGRLWGATLPP